jgi:hypothetical protein
MTNDHNFPKGPATLVEAAMFGHDAQRCPETGRLFEQGSGALSHEQQTANYLREAGRSADMPKPGECCPQTGREYETGSGCLTSMSQTRLFIEAMSPEQKAALKHAQAMTSDIIVAGNA